MRTLSTSINSSSTRSSERSVSRVAGSASSDGARGVYSKDKGVTRAHIRKPRVHCVLHAQVIHIAPRGIRASLEPPISAEGQIVVTRYEPDMYAREEIRTLIEILDGIRLGGALGGACSS